MKVAFIIPWFGENIPGGAEAECMNTAVNLNKSNICVEILTTCVKSFHSNWNENYYYEGKYKIEGLSVRRFKVRKRKKAAFDSVNFRLMHSKVEELTNNGTNLKSPVSEKEESIYIKEMINSPSLYEYIDKNQKQYDYFIPMPYMFGTTYYSSQICPEKTLIIPCLHNESYAYMNIYKKMMNRVKGLILHTGAEKRLAERLFKLTEDKLFLIGEGVNTIYSFNGDHFKNKYGFKSPFILCVGRKDSTKNIDLLIRYFLKYKRKHKKSDLKLILIGSGNIDIPHGTTPEIIDLGFISSLDKYNAYAAALLLCNPSVNESFSIVMMESWCACTPVLVNGNCEVTKDHCIASNGGLYFLNYAEFEESLNFLINRQETRIKMGENGKAYVLNNYSWDIIIKKYQMLFEKLNGNSPASS